MDIKKSKQKIGNHGEYIYRQYFLNGKQKMRKVYLVNGIPVDEIEAHESYLKMADDISLLKDGEYIELDRRYLKSENEIYSSNQDDEIPF